MMISTQNRKIFIVYVAAVMLRICLMNSKYQPLIAERVEVSTPANAWKRVREALYLKENNIDPYLGDRFHESPLFLCLYGLLLEILPGGLIFVMLDVFTAHVLYHVARKQMERVYKEQEVNKDKVGRDVIRKFLRGRDFAQAPAYVLSLYLFNPFTVASCVGMATGGFSNFFVAMVLLFLAEGNFFAFFWLSLATLHSLYPVVLLAPMTLQFAKTPRKLAAAIVFTVLIIFLLLYLNYLAVKSWNFLDNTYGFLLKAPDLQPNIGLFWYFFTEMFEHFETFFICCFQINATIAHLIALSIILRNDEVLLSYTILSLSAVFKSYPCAGDFGFVLSLLPLCPHLFVYVKRSILLWLVVGTIFVSSAVAPIYYYLWLYARSGNSNFYYGAVAAFNVAQIFLFVNVLGAYIKREYLMKHKTEDVDSVKLKLSY